MAPRGGGFARGARGRGRGRGAAACSASATARRQSRAACAENRAFAARTTASSARRPPRRHRLVRASAGARATCCAAVIGAVFGDAVDVRSRRARRSAGRALPPRRPRRRGYDAEDAAARACSGSAVHGAGVPRGPRGWRAVPRRSSRRPAARRRVSRASMSAAPQARRARPRGRRARRADGSRRGSRPPELASRCASSARWPR